MTMTMDVDAALAQLHDVDAVSMSVKKVIERPVSVRHLTPPPFTSMTTCDKT